MGGRAYRAQRALPADPTGDEVAAALDAMLAELGAPTQGTTHQMSSPTMSCLTSLLEMSGRASAELFPGGSIAYTGIGVVPRTLEGRVFLAGVYHGGPAARAGLRVGDEIVAAGGERFDPIASFAGKAGEPVTLEVRRVAAGPTFPVEVVAERIRPNELFLNALRASVRVIEHEGRRLGYVRIWSYARRQYQRVLVEELAGGGLKDVDGLVLDLRGGWGGAGRSTPSSSSVARRS